MPLFQKPLLILSIIIFAFVAGGLVSHATLAQPTAPGGSIVKSICDEGTGFCSTSYLDRSFSDKFDNAYARICHAESTGNPFLVNDVCISGVSPEYNVGLFQINLLINPWSTSTTPQTLRQAIAIAGYDPTNTTCANAFTLVGSKCFVADQKLLDICVNWFTQPLNNVEFAKILFSRGDWQQWRSSDLCIVTN